MEKEFEPFAQNLSSQVVNLRKKSNLTQGALAKLAGIPRSTIANMESGLGNPSLLNLLKVTSALQVSIEEILANPRPKVKLIRKEDIPCERKSKSGIAVYKLLPDPIPGMVIDRIELSPRVRMAGVPHSAGTKEYFHCYQGEFVIHVAGEKYRLQTGDVLTFPGDMPHAYSNSGNEHSVGLSVVALAI